MAYIKANFLAMKDENGRDLGTMATGLARDYARKKGMELVAVNENVDPPIYTVKPRQRFVPRVQDDKSQYEVTAATVRCTDETESLSASSQRLKRRNLPKNADCPLSP